LRHSRVDHQARGKAVSVQKACEGGENGIDIYLSSLTTQQDINQALPQPTKTVVVDGSF